MARRSQWASLLFLSFSAPLRLCARYLCVACATWRLTGKIEPDDRMTPRPVPPIMDIQPPKQRFAAVVQLVERIEEQALAEAPRTRQEVILAGARHRPGVRGLIDIDIALLDDLAEGLDTDRELLQRRGHWARPRHRRHDTGLDRAGDRSQPCPQPPRGRPRSSLGSPRYRPPEQTRRTSPALFNPRVHHRPSEHRFGRSADRRGQGPSEALHGSEHGSATEAEAPVLRYCQAAAVVRRLQPAIARCGLNARIGRSAAPNGGTDVEPCAELAHASRARSRPRRRRQRGIEPRRRRAG